MISIELDSTMESIAIYANAQGIDEVIRYLEFIKDKKDHIHLVVGNELSDNIIEKGDSLIRHLKLGFYDGD